MAYSLLYTRSIRSDERIRFTDVAITERSVMIDVVSFLSPFYRVAGFVYAIRPDGLTDYERGASRLLPYGKNRIVFDTPTLPYFLEFFPKWGQRQMILSVYTGEPSAPAPASDWTPQPGGDREFRIFPNGVGVVSRLRSDGTGEFVAAANAVIAHMYGSDLFYGLADGSYLKLEIGVWSPSYPISSEEFLRTRGEPGATII